MDQKEALVALERELRQLFKTSGGRRAFLMGMPILLHSCASGSKHRYREGDNKGQEAALTVSEEEKLTREYMPKMRKEYPTYQNQRVQRYISNLGHKIVTANGLQGKPYKYNFTVVNSKNVNAFALPAGTVFVTAPLIKLADSEAELAGVVGHEIGHITARHTAERMAQAKRDSGKSWLYGLGGAIVGGAAGFGLGKLLCSKQDRECLRRAATYGVAAGAGGGLLIQKFGFMANSREDEMEADRIGFRTAYQAGYNGDHVGLFYTKLLEMEKQARGGKNKLVAPLVDAMSTHPPSQQRVAQMQQMAREVNSKNKTVNTREFDKVRRILGA